ncbi:hypothetical protein, partial [Candidatus Albibeggiatoa sp. nov. BB20]|uniref:hypothetical protein n=1 Tax=Candidatus Albibeggiatoa sp. nov. BB20 TaxID=3162723 RepID=UPI0033657D36
MSNQSNLIDYLYNIIGEKYCISHTLENLEPIEINEAQNNNSKKVGLCQKIVIKQKRSINTYALTIDVNRKKDFPDMVFPYFN